MSLGGPVRLADCARGTATASISGSSGAGSSREHAGDALKVDRTVEVTHRLVRV